MKKILLTLVLMLTLGLYSNAQRTDGFFNNVDVYNSNIRTGDLDDYITPAFPQYQNGDQSAPLGTGLFLLTALGAGYAVSRRRKK